MNLLALTVVTVNIASGVAALQLNEFGTQTDAQMLFNYENMKGYRTNAVQGTMDMLVALDRMIEGTPLRYEYVNGRTVTLTVPEVHAASSGGDDGLTVSLIADGCSFGLIPSEIVTKELGEVPHSCWCCASSSSGGGVKEASCVALPAQDECSAYDSHVRKNFWSSEITSEVVIHGAEQVP